MVVNIVVAVNDSGDRHHFAYVGGMPTREDVIERVYNAEGHIMSLDWYLDTTAVYFIHDVVVEDLNEYLNKEHSCPCSDCKDVDWWESPQSAEYYIEEVTEEYE